MLTASIIVVMLILCFGILYIVSDYYRQKLSLQSEHIRFLEVENDLKDHEIVSLGTLLNKQEQERTVAMDELHDNLGSTIAALKANFESLSILKPLENEKENQLLYNTVQLLDQGYQKIKRLGTSKSFGVEAKEGLVPALKKLGSIASENTGINFQMLIFNLSERLGNAQEISILIIVHELCLNIVKHSEATEATIQLTGHDGVLNIIAEDNGVGFSTLKAMKKGNGLKDISARVAQLGGTFNTDSALGRGATILIDIPI